MTPPAPLYSPHASVQRALIWLQAALLVIVLFGFYLWPLLTLRSAVPIDFTLFYASAQALQAGADPYGPLPPEFTGLLPTAVAPLVTAGNPNLNPPLVAWLFGPLTALPLAEAYALWGILSLAAGLAAGAVIWWNLFAGRAYLLITVWLILLCYFPTFVAVRIGQLTMPMLLLLALIWWATRRCRPQLAGIFLGAAFSIKLFLALILFFYVVRRHWRTVGAALATALVAGSFGLIAAGMDAHRTFLATLGDVTWVGANWNASFAGFFGRLFGGAGVPSWLPAPGIGQLLTLASGAGSVVVLAWLAWPKPAQDRTVQRCTEDLAFGLVLALTLLLSPLGWMYYFPFLFIGGWAVWYWTETVLPRGLRWPLGAAWLASTVPQTLLPRAEIATPLHWVGSASLYFYALLLYAGMLAVALFLVARQRPA